MYPVLRRNFLGTCICFPVYLHFFLADELRVYCHLIARMCQFSCPFSVQKDDRCSDCF